MNINKLIQDDKTKRTSYDWTKLLSLKLTNIEGFPSENYYNSVLISKQDFILMASNCGHERPEHQTRQKASKLKRILSLGVK